jgi:hypothetical protein
LKKREDAWIAQVVTVKFIPFYIVVDRNSLIVYSTALGGYELKQLETYIADAVK